MYCTPGFAEVGGVPLIVGAELPAAAVTAMLNAGSHAILRPSLTPMVMLPYVPALALCGVPCSCPFVRLKVAHAGRLLIMNVSSRPSGSLAVGVKEYALPAVTVVAGVPEITGGRLCERV